MIKPFSTKGFIENVFLEVCSEMYLFLHIQKTFILHLRQIQSYSMRGLCTENHDLSVVEKQLMEVCLEQTIKKQNQNNLRMW